METKTCSMCNTEKRIKHFNKTMQNVKSLTLKRS